MRYTVHLFALNADLFAQMLKDDPQGVTTGVKEWLRDSDFDPLEQKRGLNLVRKICAGDLPDDCDEDYFWALCWIGEATLERIDFPLLTEVRGLTFLHGTGIWPLLTRTAAPFRMPASADCPPGAGFLWHDAMPAAIQLLAEPPPSDSDVDAGERQAGRFAGETTAFSPEVGPDDRDWLYYVRQQLGEVLESLGEDCLDLLAVAVSV